MDRISTVRAWSDLSDATAHGKNGVSACVTTIDLATAYIGHSNALERTLVSLRQFSSAEGEEVQLETKDGGKTITLTSPGYEFKYNSDGSLTFFVKQAVSA